MSPLGEETMGDGPNIAEIIDEFSAYEKYVAERIDSFMAENRKPYTEFFNGLFRFYYFMSFLLDKEKIKSGNNTSPLMTLYSKAALSLLGVVSCLQNGLAGEASFSLRSIFETWLTVKVILEDSVHERLCLFRDYEHIVKWLDIENNRKMIAKGLLTTDQFDSIISPALREEVEQKFRQIRQNYHPKVPYHWAWKIYKEKTKGQNPNVGFLSEHFQALPDYNQVYSSTSALIHSTPQNMNVMVAGDSFTISPNFTRLIFSVGIKALEYCCEIVKEVVAFLNPEKSPEIVNYVEEYLADLCLYVKDKHYADL